MTGDVLARAFVLTLMRVYGDWGWRKHSPVECRSWPGFKRCMAKMCAESHLRPQILPHGGFFGNTWGI